MRRRAPAEKVEPYRRKVYQAEGHELRDRLAAWAEAVSPTLAGVWPDMPAGIADRNADVWEALLTVADAAGGSWSARARVAAVALVAEFGEAPPSLGIRLLTDIRIVFGDRDVMRTEDLIRDLCGLEEAPWSDLRGKPLDAQRLANYLRPYGVRSKAVRIGTSTPRGYTREDLHDPWLRYLPVPPAKAATPATPATNGAAHCGRCKHFKAGTGEGGIGSCLHFNVETWPEPNPGCKGFQP
jgi:hypothetical protein